MDFRNSLTITIVTFTGLIGCLPSPAQTQIAPQPGSNSATMYEGTGPHFSVHAVLTDLSNVAGPKLDVGVSNTAPEATSIDPVLYPSEVVIHVQGPHGQVLPTLLGRQWFGPHLMEDPVLNEGPNVETKIAPGQTFTVHYDFPQYYKLTEPGDYVISVAARDEEMKSHKETWVRSNLLHYSLPEQRR